MNDVRKMIYGTIIGFFMMLGLWFSIIYISSCGFTLTCNRGDHLIVRTPIPTLIPSSHSESSMDMSAEEFDKCPVAAFDLVGAWVSAGAPETDPFPFEGTMGQSCEGLYSEDVQPLLMENGSWQPASLGCVSCHNGDLTDRSAGLDLTNYDAITKSGLLATSWEASRLHEYLSMGLTADGHSADSSVNNTLIFAGMPAAAEAEATPTP